MPGRITAAGRYWIKRDASRHISKAREGCRVGRYLIYKEAIERWKRMNNPKNV